MYDRIILKQFEVIMSFAEPVDGLIDEVNDIGLLFTENKGKIQIQPKSEIMPRRTNPIQEKMDTLLLYLTHPESLEDDE
jgi:hypothetical protein